MIRLALALAVLLLVALPSAASAQVCPKELVVDGRLMERLKVKEEDRLPARGAERDVQVPTCDPDAPTEPATAQTLDGVDPTIAVLMDDDLYVATGSLVQLAGHPVHDAIYRTADEPAYRRDECRPLGAPTTGTVEIDGTLTLHQGEGTTRLVVDADTRFASGPASQVLLKGQRVSVAASECGPRKVADVITLVGGALPPREFTPATQTEDEASGWMFGVGAIALVAAGGVLFWRRRPVASRT